MLQEETNENADNDEMKNNIIVSAMMMIMESSSSESEDETEYIAVQLLRRRDDVFFNALKEKCRRNSIKEYLERTVASYSETEFRSHFRISRALFTNLSQRLWEWSDYQKLRYDKRLSEEVHMLVFLWFAGHEACSFRDLSDRFNLCISSISLIIERVTMFLSSLSPEIIKWPNAQKKEETSKYFANKCLFSKAIGNNSFSKFTYIYVHTLRYSILGCIDGTHVVIDPPKTGKDEYIDRKGNTTICVQAICDENKKFINVFIGHPGSCHDSWVLKNSPIYDKLPSYCGGM